MTAVAISRHELRHVLGAAVGARMLDLDTGRIVVSVEISAGAGQVVAEVGDPVEDPGDRAASHRLAPLTAAGPISVLGDDAVPLLRAADWPEIVRRAGLSDADMALVDHLGPERETTIARLVLGVVDLERQVRTSGVERLAKALRDLVNAGVANGLPLDALVPPDRARAAAEAAGRRLSEVMR